MIGILLFRVLNKGFAVTWLILAVLYARMLLKKAPRWTACLLWALVAIRLVLPFSLVSAFSMVPSANLVQESAESARGEVPRIDSGIAVVDETVSSAMERVLAPDPATGGNRVRMVHFLLSAVWVAGVAAMLLYALISYGLLKRRVRASAFFRGRVRECDEVDSPFILGIFRPVIYVPSGLHEKTLEMVIAHEEAHLKRYDHWWKPLGFLLLSVYWFHPLCWAAYMLLCRDMEAACDEKVIRDKDRDYMAAYSQALLDLSVQRRFLAACPLAFGEIGVKERVKGVLNYKKPALWRIFAAVIACIAVAVCFMTVPKNRYFDIAVDIPAGAEGNTVWYADEEVSPRWNTLKLDTGGFYGGTLILQAIGADGGAAEQTAQIQPGTPVTFRVQRGVWYRVGIRIGEEIGEGAASVRVRVRNGEIRIASGIADAPNAPAAMDHSDPEIAGPGEAPSSPDYDLLPPPHEEAFEPLENLEVEYTLEGDCYVVEGDMVFQYKKTLIGRNPNAAHSGMYIVLTNDPDVTFEKVDRSLISSSSSDWLSDTILIGIHALDEDGNPMG